MEKKINAALAKQMTELGTKDGNGEGIRIQAIVAFGNALRSGKSNSMPIDINDENWQADVGLYASQANDAYVRGQNTAAGYMVVSDTTAKTYATYFKTLGLVAVKAPDLFEKIAPAADEYCKGKSKKDMDGRTKLHVFYRLACEVRDTIFGKSTGKKADRTLPKAMKASEVTKALVAKAIGNAATRAKRTPVTPKEETPAEVAAKVKASAIESCATLAGDKAVKIPANIRAALKLIAAWK